MRMTSELRSSPNMIGRCSAFLCGRLLRHHKEEEIVRKRSLQSKVSAYFDKASLLSMLGSMFVILFVGNKINNLASCVSA